MEGVTLLTTASFAKLDRSLLAVTGPQRAKFLHNVLTNDVAGLLPGQGRPAALLDVKGHVVALIRVLVGSEQDIVLELPADRLVRVQDLLEHYRVAAPVRFRALDGAVFGLWGPDAAAVLERLGSVPPMNAEAHVFATVEGHVLHLVRASDMPQGGFVIHVPNEAVSAGVRALLRAGATEGHREELDAFRIEEGLPWYGADVTEANLLHESGLVKTHHSSTKGCYIGQEVIARLEARGGNVNKMLRGLRLSAPAAPGDLVADEDGKELGRVTTSATSARFGPIAMAYVHRSRFDPGTILQVRNQAATVVALPFV